MSKDRPPLAVIAGPTASGKSALALEWARRTGGVIVNADASQLYRDIPIVAAAPGPEDREQADHRLYGIRDGAEPCSAADYAMLARSALAEVEAAGKTALLVGGTGLYLRALLEGLAPVPPIDPAVRAAIRAALHEDNRRALEAEDPAAASRLGPNDRARTARALEVIRSTGRPLSAWQADRDGGIGRTVDLRAVVLLPPREWLYARCDERFARIFDDAGPEVEALLSRRLRPELPVMKAIGVREIASYLRGESPREAAIAAGQQSTRRYAKRQYTWFAHQPPPGWARVGEPLDAPGAMDRALALL